MKNLPLGAVGIFSYVEKLKIASSNSWPAAAGSGSAS